MHQLTNEPLVGLFGSNSFSKCDPPSALIEPKQKEPIFKSSRSTKEHIQISDLPKFVSTRSKKKFKFKNENEISTSLGKNVEALICSSLGKHLKKIFIKNTPRSSNQDSGHVWTGLVSSSSLDQDIFIFTTWRDRPEFL